MTDPKTAPREVTIKVPRLPKEKGLLIAGGIGFIVAFIFASTILKELNQLKQQQKTAEERIKKEVLMPGGSTAYETEFKPDPSTAKDSATPVSAAAAPVTPAAPAALAVPAVPAVSTAPAVPAAPAAPAPQPAPAPSGPGNFDSSRTPSYGGGSTGPGNMQ